nr:MAG TPA: hypothetical protein [Caudoviricetes sp.]
MFLFLAVLPVRLRKKNGAEQILLTCCGGIIPLK